MTIVKKMRIPDGSSVFTAEAKAIDLALDFVNTPTYTDKFVIFSDSLSVLQALNHTSSNQLHVFIAGFRAILVFMAMRKLIKVLKNH